MRRLRAVPREKERIDLYWTPIRNAVRYEVYREGEKIGETPYGYVCTHRDGSVVYGSTYQYFVRAVDRLGNALESIMVEIAHCADILANSDGRVSREARALSKCFALLKNGTEAEVWTGTYCFFGRTGC